MFVENQFDRRLKVFRSDNGGEYTSNKFEQFLKSEGVKHETSIPKTPEQNGVAERLNRSLVEAVRTMLHEANLPKKFWAEALSTATYVRNRCPTSALTNKTPFEALTGSKPNVKHLRTFGCTAYAHIPKDERKKMDSKSRKCMFLGYSANQKGYRLFDLAKRKVFFCRDVIFNETENILVEDGSQENSHEDIDVDKYVEIPLDAISDDVADDRADQAKRVLPARNRRPPDRLGEWTCMLESADEPQSFKEAVSGDESQLWKQAMRNELNSMEENKV